MCSSAWVRECLYAGVGVVFCSLCPCHQVKVQVDTHADM